MKDGSIHIFLSILIGIVALTLCSCAPHKRFLAAEATMIHLGDQQSAVVELLGRPEAVRRTGKGIEWYYYEKHRPFYGKIPLLGHYVGKERVDALMVLLREGRVADVIYYVAKK